MWWEQAVVYQIYPRSFLDADGDGLGDLRGATQRLEYVASLGAQAIWLSPFYPSSDYDFGYDVSNFSAIDPRFGTFDDFDALLTEARRLGLRVLMDLVPCHTSIDHPWFRERADFYVIRDTPEPPNNWRAAFGGSTWSRDPYGRGWYLHSFYPEQPDLDWRNPEVVAAMQDVVRFWLARGVDGLRLDALDRLMKDPELRDDPPRRGPPPLPLHREHATLDHVHSRNAPDIGTGLAALRAAAGERLLVGEVYLPNAELGPYLRHLDLAFSFELHHARFEADAIRAALASAADTHGVAWVLSNHDFRRLPNRVGSANVRLAALLLLTLPGCAFVYQGDELGVPDGPEGPLPRDRHGRDGFRNPMPWGNRSGGGFTTGKPWLPPATAPGGSAAAQEGDPGSMLHLYRRLIALHRELPMTGLEFVDRAERDVLAYRRGEHLVLLNLGDAPVPLPPGEIVVSTAQRPPTGPENLPPHSGVDIRTG